MAARRGVVASAPARANLLGNPSDQYGGVTLACSVPLRATVSLAPSERGEIVLGDDRARVGGAEDLEPRDDGFDLARAVLVFLGLQKPELRITLESEIPRQSGLAGSTALVVSMLRALLAWQGRTPHPYVLAEMARAVERTRMGVQCGFVDQYLCVFGGLRYVDFRGKELDLEDGAGPLATVEDLGAHSSELPFVLANTGVQHSSDAVHRPIRERWLEGEPEVVLAYERIAELGLYGKKALLLDDWEAFGVLMNENHAIQRDLGGSGPANDALVDAALAAGALGAKLAGAGGGGTIVALSATPDTAALARALENAGASQVLGVAPVEGVRLEAET